MISFNYLASPGELGNQMFKYAALKGISNELKLDFLIPPSYQILNNKFVFKTLNKLKVVDNRNHSNHLLFKYFKMNSVKSKNIGYADFKDTINEKHFEFDTSFFNSKLKSFDILGYFQTYKYFENISYQIKDDFTFKNKIQKKSLDVLEKLDEPISLHVRRGDYVTNVNHSPLDIKYYQQSIEEMGPQNQFLIFTDDVSWCKSIKTFSGENFIFADDFNNGKEDLDLSLMTLCNNHIIANSTYSWWGAWLSKKGKVIAPKYWFKNSEYSHYNTQDLYPKDWEIIVN